VGVGHVEYGLVYSDLGEAPAQLYDLLGSHQIGGDLDGAQSRLLYLNVVSLHVLAVPFQNPEFPGEDINTVLISFPKPY
jgi:hypothetical protein